MGGKSLGEIGVGGLGEKHKPLLLLVSVRPMCMGECPGGVCMFKVLT